VYVDGAWISLGHCMCDKWCPCWICVMFRTKFESLSQMMHKQCVSVFSCSFYSQVQL
jgi:hypothetical protein